VEGGGGGGKKKKKKKEKKKKKTSSSSSSFRITAKIVLHSAVYKHSRPAVCYAKILKLEYLQGFLLCVTRYRTEV
jgi:hypothetical protein